MKAVNLSILKKTSFNQDLPNALLVEDEKISREITRMFLKDICNVDFAPNGEEALGLVKSKKYDLILMDIGLGRGMNGMETAQSIKKNDSYKNVPIIALTAYAMKGDKEEFLANGCSHYISRPVEKQKLIQLVKSIIKDL